MISECPKCQRLQQHDKNKVLVLCWLCLMLLADRENKKQSEESARWDWQETFRGIHKGERLDYRAIALQLKTTPDIISQVKTGKRPISPQLFNNIKECYSKYIVENRQK